jgi:hypothetical protein
MSEYQESELRVGNGSSDKNITEAVHNAIKDALRGEEIGGIPFSVTISAVTEHHSPWHITYNAAVQQTGGS